MQDNLLIHNVFKVNDIVSASISFILVSDSNSDLKDSDENPKTLTIIPHFVSNKIKLEIY